MSCLPASAKVAAAMRVAFSRSANRRARIGTPGRHMPRAIRSTRNGTFANAALPPFGEGIATVRQAVHDGETVNVAPDGDFAIRFLGVDTAERSFDFPLRAGEPPRENPLFLSLGNAEWETFLSDPFSNDWRPFNPPLDAALRANLQARTGAGAAGNHDVWARAGERLLEGGIERDRADRSLALGHLDLC